MPRADDLRALATTLATDAGRVALAGRRAAAGINSLGAKTKSSSTDIVTEFDRAAEASIVATLRELRPDDGIVGEEGTALTGTSGYDWYIDPIDGTTSFFYDHPTWACSVGVSFDGEMVAGAVSLPALDELFSAELGHGATLNGRTISASACDDVALALVGTGFSYHADARRAHAALLARIIGDIRDIRRTGSAAVDLCFVAAGRLDLYFEPGLNAWDMAAGELIAREAGAIASDFAGGPSRPEEMLVAAPGVHAAFLALLNKS
jgi:myo-inositol-1(or 4)-monophosphatase